MTDNDQKQFIQNVRMALGKPVEGGPAPELFHVPPPDLEARLAHYQSKTPAEREAILDELITRAEAVQMMISTVTDPTAAGKAIHDLILEKTPEWGSEKRVVAWDHPLINDLNLEARLSEEKIPVTTTQYVGNPDDPGERKRLRCEVEAAYIGITSADFVVAHTATLVMKSRPLQLRSVSLVPSIHVCVVTQDQLMADLEELYTRLQWDPDQQSEGITNSMTFISAPSKTGDIELVMVNGAHGPREVHLFVITG